MKKRLSGGFTLIEMMVVIVILGVLALVLVVSFAGKDDKAKKAATRSIIEQVSNQIEEFKMDHGQYPRSLEELRRRPDFVSDQTSAHDPLDGYVPPGFEGMSKAERHQRREQYINASQTAMAAQVEAMCTFQDSGCITFDYDNVVTFSGKASGS